MIIGKINGDSMSKYQEIKKEYEDLYSLVAKNLPGADKKAFEGFYFDAVTKVWSGNELYSPDYKALIDSVCSEKYSEAAIRGAMTGYRTLNVMFAVPAFFSAFVGNVRKSKPDLVYRFLQKLNDLLVASAMINGDFTIPEANNILDIVERFRADAYIEGVQISKAFNNFGKVTDTKDASYVAGPAPADPDTAEEDDDESFESLMAELDSLVGLERVKQDVHSLMNFIKVSNIRKERGMTVPAVSYHLVFTGNPGTGKTTVARLVGKLYHKMGLLPKGQLVECEKSSLVAGYLGQTAIKTQAVIEKALGGVLFIDEAYSLTDDERDFFGREAVETILKAMEDHRDELIVIVAGYTELMHEFIDSNPGLQSRFNKYFEFPDYTGEELLAIFRRFCSKNGYKLDASAENQLLGTFDLLYEERDDHFGNARAARNIFEKAIHAQADRLAALEGELSDSELELINAEDIKLALKDI